MSVRLQSRGVCQSRLSPAAHRRRRQLVRRHSIVESLQRRRLARLSRSAVRSSRPKALSSTGDHLLCSSAVWYSMKHCCRPSVCLSVPRPMFTGGCTVYPHGWRGAHRFATRHHVCRALLLKLLSAFYQTRYTVLSYLLKSFNDCSSKVKVKGLHTNRAIPSCYFQFLFCSSAILSRVHPV